jgi:DNA-binding response OmpR family regulator
VLDHDRDFVTGLAAPMRARGWKVTELSRHPEPGELQALALNALLVNVSTLTGDVVWLFRQVAETPSLAIIACSEHSTVTQRVEALRSGLDGWIETSCDPDEVLARLQAVIRARHSTAVGSRPATIRSGELEVRRSVYDAVVDGHRAGLTTREFEVLELLAGHEGAVLERQQIYAGVWGADVPLGERSVDIFVSRIRLKLKRISPGWRYLHTHAGIGYRFEAQDVLSAAADVRVGIDSRSETGYGCTPSAARPLAA